MITVPIDEKALFISLDEVWEELLNLVSSTNEAMFNKIPFAGSWTVAQLATHITKSNFGMVKAFEMEGKAPTRDPSEGVARMRNIFLDFTRKYQSPEFILPETKVFDKESVVGDLKRSIEGLQQKENGYALSEMLQVQIFGEVSRFELFHFILFHTQRHLRQLKNILKEL